MTLAQRLHSLFHPKTVESEQSYFFIPCIGEGFDSEIFFTDQIQNTSVPKRYSGLELLVSQFNPTHNWQVTHRIPFGESGKIRLKASDLGLKVGEVAVASIARNGKPEVIPGEIPLLFAPTNDFSVVAPRCRLGFSKGGAFSSYSAEYLRPMMVPRKGLTLTMGQMASYRPPGTRSWFVFVNILLSPTEPGRLRIVDANTGETYKTQSIPTNRVSLIELDMPTDAPLTFFVDGLIGVPIFLHERLSATGQLQISCEHTHPPAEFFFTDKLAQQGALKRRWLEKYPVKN